MAGVVDGAAIAAGGGATAAAGVAAGGCVTLKNRHLLRNRNDKTDKNVHPILRIVIGAFSTSESLLLSDSDS